MNHDKSPIAQAVDLAVFGPLGLALAAKDALPAWVDQGRRRIVHQVDVARIVGEHATRHGQKVVARTLIGLGILPGPAPPVRASVAPRPDDDRMGPAPSVGDGRVTTGPAAPSTVTSPGRVERSGVEPGAAVPGSAELAIPGYDSLSAFQVVQRLAGLAPSELEAVRTYEAAGRGRRTILTKISQLQTGRS